MFQITRGSGFRIEFKNGWAVSVQWGEYNYCSYDDEGHAMTAEIAVINPEGDLTDMGNGDTVMGHCTPEEVIRVMMATAQRK